MTPADNLAAHVANVIDGMARGDDFRDELQAALTAYRAAKDEAYQVTIHGQYDAATHCVRTTYGEPLVAFETDEGSLQPFDGKQVSVTVRGE